MKRYHSCEFALYVLVQCDDETQSPREEAAKVIEKLDLPSNVSVDVCCNSIISEGEGLIID